MPRLLGIAGSLRRGSYNLALLRAARDLMPVGSELDIATLEDIPLYNGDSEADAGIPEAVSTLKDRVASADGVILATPEYNNSMAGVTKNAIDWLTRPPGDIGRVFGRRPFALVGATPGGFGTVLGQAAWLPVMRTLGVRLWTGGKLYVSGAGNAFDDDGRLVDDGTRDRLRAFLENFVEFTREP